MITEELKDAIRARVDLASVIRRAGFPLRRSGRGWRGPCPFEPTRPGTTKFSVCDAVYRCFGCQTVGDVFDWFGVHEQLTFPAAVARAAALAGISVAIGTVEPHGTESGAAATAVDTLDRLADLSHAVARALPAGERVARGIDLSRLIESGDIGRFPLGDQLQAAMERHTITTEQLARAGLRDRGTRLAAQWILWAVRGGRVVAGRPLGRREPVIGERGAASGGWVMPRGAMRGRTTFLTVDDDVYLMLRSQGAERVALALTDVSLADVRGVPGLRDRQRPPMLLALPHGRGRRRAARAARAVIRRNAYLRAIECPPPALFVHDPDAWRQAMVAAVHRGGHVLDWQMGLLRALGTTASNAGQARARRQLSELVAAIPDTYRLWYADQVEHAMGFTLDRTLILRSVRAPTPDHQTAVCASVGRT